MAGNNLWSISAFSVFLRKNGPINFRYKITQGEALE